MTPQIHWLSMPAAPESLLHSVNHSSKARCTSQRCSCKWSCVVCTGVCQRTSCENCFDLSLDRKSIWIHTKLLLVTPIVLVMRCSNTRVLTVNECFTGHHCLYLYLLSKFNYVTNGDLSRVCDFSLDFDTFPQE